MLNIIPKPLCAKELEGKVALSKNTKLCGAFAENFDVLAPLFADAADAAENTLTFVANADVAEEGYRIACADGNITVEAADAAGAFYAVMTLLQIADGEAEIPAVEIEDTPRYHHRGFMLDCARHFWTVEKIKEILDVMARIKMNIFHWHLTEDQGWRIEIKKYPLLTEKGAIRKSTALCLTGYDEYKEPRDYTEYGRGLYYTQDQAREIVAYAAARHINIVPEIDMPGHFVAAIACYPELSCTGEAVEVSDRWGILDNIACCGKENIYNFIKDIIDELVEVFPYPYFHIGGDEVPKDRWEVCPNCQAKIKELGLKDENALQLYFNNVISAYLKSKGRSTMGWNEILEGGELDPEIIPQWWRSMDDDVRELKWLADGNKLILSMVEYVYMDHAFAIRPLKKTYDFGPEVFGLKDDTGVFGVEAPQWTEYIRDTEKLDLNTFPRLLAMAEVGWTSAANKCYDCFEARVENLRGYFESIKAPIAPQFIYRGETIDGINDDNRLTIGWEAWRADPNFEVALKNKA